MKRQADLEWAGSACTNSNKSLQKWNDKGNKHGEWRILTSQWSAAAGSFEMCKCSAKI